MRTCLQSGWIVTGLFGHSVNNCRISKGKQKSEESMNPKKASRKQVYTPFNKTYLNEQGASTSDSQNKNHQSFFH